MSNLLTLGPNGNGNASQHTPIGDTPNWKCVDEAVSDGDATHVRHVSAGDGTTSFKTDWYNYDNTGGQVGPILNVRLLLEAKYHILDGGGLATLTVQIRHNGVTYSSAAFALTGSYATYVLDLPVGSTWAQLDGMQGGPVTSARDGGSGGTTEIRVTKARYEITFDDAFVPGATATIVISGQQPQFQQDDIFIPAGTATILLSTGEFPEYLLEENPAEHQAFVFDPRARIPTRRGIR